MWFVLAGLITCKKATMMRYFLNVSRMARLNKAQVKALELIEIVGWNALDWVLLSGEIGN